MKLLKELIDSSYKWSAHFVLWKTFSTQKFWIDFIFHHWKNLFINKWKILFGFFCLFIEYEREYIQSNVASFRKFIENLNWGWLQFLFSVNNIWSIFLLKIFEQFSIQFILSWNHRIKMSDQLEKSNHQPQHEDGDDPERKRQNQIKNEEPTIAMEVKTITNIYYDCLERIFDFLDLQSLLNVAGHL